MLAKTACRTFYETIKIEIAEKKYAILNRGCHGKSRPSLPHLKKSTPKMAFVFNGTVKSSMKTREAWYETGAVSPDSPSSPAQKSVRVTAPLSHDSKTARAERKRCGLDGS
jgi:hypothetical protein